MEGTDSPLRSPSFAQIPPPAAYGAGCAVSRV